MQLCMKEYVIEEKHWEFLQYLLSNAPYHLIAKKDIIYEYINVSEELSHISRKEDFLEKLHLLTEKDPNSFLIFTVILLNLPLGQSFSLSIRYSIILFS